MSRSIKIYENRAVKLLLLMNVNKMLLGRLPATHKKYGEYAKPENENNRTSPHIIQIRYHVYNNPNKLLSNDAIMDTICHEIAHCVVFKHNKKHEMVHRLLLSICKSRGWYSG